MKLFVVLLICFISKSQSLEFFHKQLLRDANLPPSANAELDELDADLVVDQIRDHFNPQDNATWKQRYLVNETFFVKGKQNVAFIMLSGNHYAFPMWMNSGAWIKTAENHNALLFQLEHRFYGKSQPTKDLSTDNLRLLTSEQALADAANFIKQMNKKYDLGKNVKWIAFGGFYSGNLAAWLRQKYPHLVHGAVASSAPVLSKLDFLDFYGVVKDDLSAVGGQQCVDAIQTATTEMKKLLTSPKVSDLDELFHLCTPIKESLNIPANIDILFDSLANQIGLTAVNNEISRFSEKEDILLKTICGIMNNKTIGSEIQRYAEVNNRYLQMFQAPCTNFMYSDLINYLKIDTFDLGGGRQWFYQRCTQFPQFQTSTSAPHIFSDLISLEYWVQQCIDIFGEEYNKEFIEKGVYETNLIYGGQNFDASNVVFVHGSVDPWHPLGVLESKEYTPVILINGTSHMADMYDETKDDSAELKAARKQINDYVAKWLSQ